MYVKTLCAVVGLLAWSGAASAEPLFPSLALASLTIAEDASTEPAAPPRAPTGLEVNASDVYFATNDLDIVEDPLFGYPEEWETPPTARASFAEMRERFETGDTPQITLTRFSTQ